MDHPGRRHVEPPLFPLGLCQFLANDPHRARLLESRDRGFGAPGRLAVMVNYHREVPWAVVADMIDMCKRLGITEVDLDSDD